MKSKEVHIRFLTQFYENVSISVYKRLEESEID